MAKKRQTSRKQLAAADVLYRVTLDGVIVSGTGSHLMCLFTARSNFNELNLFLQDLCHLASC